MTPADLLTELERRGVKLTLAGDRLHVEAPAGVLTPDLKETLAKHKAALLTLLEEREGRMTIWPGVVVRIHPMRPACQAAGHCLMLTKEADCGLYWVRPGWCRERVATSA